MYSVLKEVRRIADCGLKTSGLKQKPTTPIVAPDSPSKTARQAVSQLRMLSGLDWDRLANLFGISTVDAHSWASGEPLSPADAEKLDRILDVVQYISRGNPNSNRNLLMSNADDGRSYLDILAVGEYDLVKQILGAGNAPPKPKLGNLSEESEISRRPPNPADLINAFPDPIHQEVGESRAAKSVRSRQK
jgi:hypothetical protein